MTINNDDFSNSDYSYKIDLAVPGKTGLWIERGFGLKTGEKLAFTVKLDTQAETSLRDLDVRSVERAIEILTAFLDATAGQPEQAPQSRPISDRLA